MWRKTMMSGSAVAAVWLMGTAPAQANGFLFPAWPPVWSTAVKVDALSHATAADGCPIESADGLSIFIASNRDGLSSGSGDPNDIWAADRASIGSPWQAPRKLEAPITSGSADFCPTPVRGRSLMFVSTRPAAGACGDGDMTSRGKARPAAGASP